MKLIVKYRSNPSEILRSMLYENIFRTNSSIYGINSLWSVEALFDVIIIPIKIGAYEIFQINFQSLQN